MDVNIREAESQDCRPLFDLARLVKIDPEKRRDWEGSGFLVDVSLEQYSYYIAHDDVLVMESGTPNEIVGFSIVLGPESIDKVGIRELATRTEWDPSFEQVLDQGTSAYYEQLAVHPRFARSIYPLYLSFMSVYRAFEKWSGIVAAVASGTLPNAAPLSLAGALGWAKVGTIRHIPSDFGELGYDLYYLGRSVFESKLTEPDVSAFFRRLKAKDFFP